MTRNTPHTTRCKICDVRPYDSRSARDLRRHHDRKHATKRTGWICVDPHVTDALHKTDEGWGPTRPVNFCKVCEQLKTYATDYDAAAHLRRTHFDPRDEAKGGHGQKTIGVSGGAWSPIKWLRSHGWVERFEVGHAVFDEVAAANREQSHGALSHWNHEGEDLRSAKEMSLDPYPQPCCPSTLFGNSCGLLSTTNGPYGIPAPAAELAMMTQRPTDVYYSSCTQLPTPAPTVSQNETASDSSDDYDARSEDSAVTTLDEELLLNLKNVSRVARLDGTWIVDLDYEDSLLPRKCFGQLLLSNPRFSHLAKEAHFIDDCCRVQWHSESMSLLEAELSKIYAELAERLDTLCSTQDRVQWYAHDSAYTIEGSTERHHLCLGTWCQRCENWSLAVAPVPRDAR